MAASGAGLAIPRLCAQALVAGEPGPRINYIMCIMRNVRWCWNLLGLWLSHRFRRAKPSPGNIEARLPA